MERPGEFMKLLSMELVYFSSYKHLQFNFENRGLTFVQGATGSGKSTLQDAPAWILYGVTAKDGNVDDVRSWHAPDRPTTGSIELYTKYNARISVTRVRGKSSENDLYWVENDTTHRGKDITETQLLLEEKLGVSRDLYMAGAYYNEFSPTGKFFTSSLKDKRELFENLADLELPILIAERAADESKQSRKNIIQISQELSRQDGRIEQLKRSQIAVERDVELWEEVQARESKRAEEKIQAESQQRSERLKYLLENRESFYSKIREVTTSAVENLSKMEEKLNEVDEVCPTCRQPDENYTRLSLEIEDYRAKIVAHADKKYPQDEEIKKLMNYKEEPVQKQKTNPFLSSLERYRQDTVELKNHVSELTAKLQMAEARLQAIKRLQDLSLNLRGYLLKKSVKQVEKITNGYLEKHFDSEIRVCLDIPHGDNLEVQVKKNSLDCVFNQLSKGQRTLLKLCFSIAVMQIAANKAGVSFNTLLFDEALDGLDSNLKNKAFGLFDELAKRHETILVVEHSSELYGMFTSHLHVKLVNDESIIYE